MQQLRKTRRLCLAIAALLVSMLAIPAPGLTQTSAAVSIDGDDIGGVVRGANGPEAGVWVIAETNDLPTRFTRSVVTDDFGRYVIPDLPKAKYQIWVRGYGLVDSPKVEGEPGRSLDLTAVLAPNAAAAAQYYPAIYWYSMLKIPDESHFGPSGDVPADVSRLDYLNLTKSNGCVGCHQIGQLSTRTIPKAFADLGTGQEAWMRRTQSGQAGEAMVNLAAARLGGVPYQNLGDWTTRIAKGELPKSTPPRPSGPERNVVVTTWDWASEKAYLHDLSVSDKRNPTVNAFGPVFGQPEYSTDTIPILNPVTNTVSGFKAPVRDPDMPKSLVETSAKPEPVAPSAYWGDEAIWDNRINNHNSMIDGQGRMWLAASVRAPKNPAFCLKGSDHPSAKAFPLAVSARQMAILDPKTMKYTFIDTCFTTHHLNFAMDANNTVWASSGGGGGAVGWFNTRLFDETGDAQKAQGWTAFIIDTNGNGKRDDYSEPNQPVDPTKDKRIDGGFYAIMVSPTDGAVWGTLRPFLGLGSLARVNPGSNPPETALTEIYRIPQPGFGPRGADIDSNGVVWLSLSSGHLGAFDRRKCKGPLNGPTATGDQCPEGWSLYRYPGPGFEGVGENSAESSYYTWVDQHDTFGLGTDTPISTGNLSDGLIAYKDGKFITLKVPYPMGFYAKGIDGRIDDTATGWKGRGLWVSSGDRTPWLQEGGKGRRPMAVHFQFRPNPLAH